MPKPSDNDQEAIIQEDILPVRSTVCTTSWTDHLKTVKLETGLKLRVPRSACLSDGDCVEIAGSTLAVICKDGRVPILPTYIAFERLQIGSLSFEFVVKEITEPDEFEAYQALCQYHYRGRILRGRTAKLIIRSFNPLYPQVVGYIELATPFYMNKARAALLNAPFKYQGIAWDAWNMEASKTFTNLVVRIARCVIYPEFRGLGLGQRLLKHAADFARTRWQVGGMRPLFLEISADMLKFVPFAERAGMTFIGETEGNLARVAKDIGYLLANKHRVDAGDIVKETSCGIVDTQVARMNRASKLLEQEQWTVEDLISRLEKLSESIVLRDFAVFHDIVSLPKPTYLQGLVPKSDEFVKRRAVEVAPRNGPEPTSIRLDKLTEDLILDNVSVTYQSAVRRTKQTHAIHQAFGISPTDISHEILRRFSLRLQPGSVTLLTGASGSGKSTLLRLLSREQPKQTISGTVRFPEGYRSGTFAQIKSQKALIEVLGQHDVRSTVGLMALVGLSDAFIFLKRFDQLSNGQQYRAMLAQLISENKNVWLADEFCASLDIVTANIVAERLQSVARSLGAILVVASSQPESFLNALRPDMAVQLTTAWEHRVISGSQIVAALAPTNRTYRAKMFSVSDVAVTKMMAGQDVAVARSGTLNIDKGFLLLRNRSRQIPATVVEVHHTRLACLTHEHAQLCGFAGLQELKDSLQIRERIWSDNEPVTLVRMVSQCRIG